MELNRQSIDDVISHHQASIKHLSNLIETKELKYETILATKKELDTVIQFFEKVIDMNTKSTRVFIESLINDGIEYVIGDNSVSIKIESSIKNNKVQYAINILDNKNNIEGGTESFGGGILAIISFIFRIVIMHISKMFPLIVIDENLTFVSHHYQERLSQFIKHISSQFNINVLMISHSPKLNTYADKIYEMKKVDGISRLEESVNDLY